jgi:hypothetical protein
MILVQDPTPYFIIASRRICDSSLVHPGDRDPFHKLGLSEVNTRRMALLIGLVSKNLSTFFVLHLSQFESQQLKKNDKK